MPAGVERIRLYPFRMERAVGEEVDISLAVQEGLGAMDVVVRMEEWEDQLET